MCVVVVWLSHIILAEPHTLCYSPGSVFFLAAAAVPLDKPDELDGAASFDDIGIPDPPPEDTPWEVLSPGEMARAIREVGGVPLLAPPSP